MRKRENILMVIGLMFIALNVSAEVMDKEPSLLQNISWGIFGGVLWYLAARYKPWLLLILIPLPVLHFRMVLGEINSPYIGKFIMIEAGPVYVYSAYGLALFLVACAAIGLILRRRAFRAIR